MVIQDHVRFIYGKNVYTQDNKPPFLTLADTW